LPASFPGWQLERLSIRDQPVCQPLEYVPDRHPVFTLQGTFPNNTAAPSGYLQGSFRTGINLTIARDLCLPEFFAGLRPLEKITVVAMPETSMGKQNRMAPRKHHVGLARERAVVKPEAKTCPVQTAAQQQFGLRIRTPDASHHAAADFRGYDINHAQ
jgi:hypothetical protein